jgi:hypothetical protein
MNASAKMLIMHCLLQKRKDCEDISVEISISGLDRPLGSRTFRLPEFLDIWHMKVFQPYILAPFNPQEISLALISASSPGP